MKKCSILSPCGILGYGFPEKSFMNGMDKNPDAIVVDAGSTDAGPHKLGAGVSIVSRMAAKKDLTLIIVNGVKRQLKMQICFVRARFIRRILQIRRVHRKSFRGIVACTYSTRWLVKSMALVLNGWGIEGEDYVVNEDGTRDITGEIDALVVANPDYNVLRGIRSLYSVINFPTFTSDGQSAFSRFAPYYNSEGGTDARDTIIKPDAVYNWHEEWKV